MRDNSPKGTYPNCSEHLTTAGVRIKEAAELAGISVSSVGRMVREDPVSITTISKLINALNNKHFIAAGEKLQLEKECKKTNGA